MNEVVSPSYTLTVYRTADIHVIEEPLHRIIERLLSLAQLCPKGGYEFKVYRLFSKRTKPTLEFEHTRRDSVYRYPCRIGNVAGLQGIFEAALKIPPNEGFHSGINDELNRAATKLLTELPSTPVLAVDSAPPSAAILAPSTPPTQVAPAPLAPAPVEAAPSPAPATRQPVPKVKRRPRKKASRTPFPKAAKRRGSPSVKEQLQRLKYLVAQELRKKQSEVAALQELQCDLERMEVEQARRAETLARLKNLS